jgi:hypothetical protein
MLFSGDPSETTFYEPETRYEKLVIRQATALDVHPYELLSARAMLDIPTLVSFTEQDNRIVGQEAKRVDKLFYLTTSHQMQLNALVDEGVEDERDVEPVMRGLIKRDKRGKEV